MNKITVRARKSKHEMILSFYLSRQGEKNINLLFVAGELGGGSCCCCCCCCGCCYCCGCCCCCCCGCCCCCSSAAAAAATTVLLLLLFFFCCCFFSHYLQQNMLINWKWKSYREQQRIVFPQWKTIVGITVLPCK